MILNIMNENEFNLNLEEMAKAGLHFGHKTSKLHPKMLPFIYGVRNGIHIIDLEKAKQKFIEALKFFQTLYLEGKTILIVGCKFEIRELVKNFALEFNFPYVIERWIGGTFTNFEVIKKRCEYFKNLEEKMKNEEIMKNYTKKERKKMEEELEKLRKKFEGIKNLEKLPDAVFIVDNKKDHHAIKEANRKGIKIIAICDTDCDPSKVDYPIPANNDSVSSVSFILNKIREAILKVKKI